LKFLSDPKLTTQRIAYECFYQGLLEHKAHTAIFVGRVLCVCADGGSNLELP